jgi:hypothetical protein
MMKWLANFQVLCKAVPFDKGLSFIQVNILSYNVDMYAHYNSVHIVSSLIPLLVFLKQHTVFLLTAQYLFVFAAKV